ncbi:MAG: hypothetical protein R2710_22560 [Acidimicrobiales bacterium]
MGADRPVEEGRQVLEQWTLEEPALHGFDTWTPSWVVRTTSTARRDVLAALIRCGANDSLAWRRASRSDASMVCTTNRSAPGPGPAQRCGHGSSPLRSRIAEYPTHRRPNNIGGNIGLDVRQIAPTTLFRYSGKEIPDPMVFHPVTVSPSADPAERLVDVPGDAGSWRRGLARRCSPCSPHPRQDAWIDELCRRARSTASQPPPSSPPLEAMIIADVA